jgi:hypothetical protein
MKTAHALIIGAAIVLAALLLGLINGYTSRFQMNLTEAGRVVLLDSRTGKLWDQSVNMITGKNEWRPTVTSCPK